MKLDELLAEAARRRAIRDEAQRLLDDADQAVMQERFRDVPRYAYGDIILVRRKLFGETRLWPAQVTLVHRSGEDVNGKPWENKIVSYGVFLQQTARSAGPRLASTTMRRPPLRAKPTEGKQGNNPDSDYRGGTLAC